MKFTKMQGIGNDYIYVNCFQESVADPHMLAKKLSDRHFGVGSDGLVLICPSNRADFKMRMFNADGSEAQMCGNAIRCVGKYVFERNMTAKDMLTVETLGGIKTLRLIIDSKKTVSGVRVNMGKPLFLPGDIPVLMEGEDVVNREIEVGGLLWRITCVSMGNPHVVVYVPDVDRVDIEKTGPLFENHPVFPQRVNTEFVQVLDEKTLKMRVWERGAGETLACGTGACAVLAASVLNRLCARQADILLRGGRLHIEWDEETGCIYKTGGAAFVFEGETID